MATELRGGPEEIALLAATVADVLDGRVLERDELIDEVAARAGHRELDEHLRSGWGALLKPLGMDGTALQRSEPRQPGDVHEPPVVAA